MKKIIFLLVCFSFPLFNLSCKKTQDKVDELTEFDMNYSTDFTVPSSSVSVNIPADFTTPDVTTNSSSTFSSQKTVSSKVTEIKLTKFEMVSGGGDFDYLKSIIIYMQAAGQPEIQLATKTSIPTGISTLSLDLSGNNIKDYIFGTAFKLRVNVVIDGAITANKVMKLNQTMHVKAVLIN